MPVCKMEVLMWMLPFPQPNLYLVHGIRRHCGARLIEPLLLLYYCVYIIARSVYCPLSAGNICAIAFSVWPLLLKETPLLCSVSVSAWWSLCSLASHAEGDSSTLSGAIFIMHSASSLASLLWCSLELLTLKLHSGVYRGGTFFTS